MLRFERLLLPKVVTSVFIALLIVNAISLSPVNATMITSDEWLTGATIDYYIRQIKEEKYRFKQNYVALFWGKEKRKEYLGSSESYPQQKAMAESEMAKEFSLTVDDMTGWTGYVTDKAPYSYSKRHTHYENFYDVSESINYKLTPITAADAKYLGAAWLMERYAFGVNPEQEQDPYQLAALQTWIWELCNEDKFDYSTYVDGPKLVTYLPGTDIPLSRSWTRTYQQYYDGFFYTGDDPVLGQYMYDMFMDMKDNYDVNDIISEFYVAKATGQGRMPKDRYPNLLIARSHKAPPVPEPSTMLLLGIGLIGFSRVAMKKKG